MFTNNRLVVAEDEVREEGSPRSLDVDELRGVMRGGGAVQRLLHWAGKTASG